MLEILDLSSICLVHMKVFAKFDEIPSMILQDIKETKHYGHMVGRMDGRSDNEKTVYPPTNTVCRGGGYKYIQLLNLLCTDRALINYRLFRRRSCSEPGPVLVRSKCLDE